MTMWFVLIIFILLVFCVIHLENRLTKVEKHIEQMREQIMRYVVEANTYSEEGREE